MIAEGADKVIIVTSGIYTDEAIEFASNKHIALIDGIKLRKIITQTKKTLSSDLKNNSSKNVTKKSIPHCPLCSALMIERTVKKGRWAGIPFWVVLAIPNVKGLFQKLKTETFL